ncbi:dipeptide ABC transporter ATP-binding protein [Sutterella wadsworthensis]|uniref:dipeptide ABC transporter ATP-binding protein n=1 Tax=Sutterella wadsworthensis TaxID=40545 RepID=UPI003AB94887
MNIQSEPSLLSVDRLTIDLPLSGGVLHPVRGVSFTVRRGEALALVGESGCGKSLTAMALMRLLPEDAQVPSGTVTLEGRELLSLTEQEMERVRGAGIAVIFQEPATSFNPVMTVGDQVAEMIRTHSTCGRTEARARAVEWLRRVGIPRPEEAYDAYPHELSGGLKQRAMIAMALSADPKVVVADEPTTALDVTVARQVLELLNDLKHERGLTLIFITHDLALLPGIADRVALMYAGEIVEMAPTEAFLAHPEHPYAQALLGALPRPDGAPLQPVEGSVPNLWGPLKGCAFAPRCARAKAKCFEYAPVPQSRRDGLGTVRCIFAGDKTTAECRAFAAPEAVTIDEREPVLELQHAAVRTAPKGFTQSLAAFVGRAVGRTILPDCTLALHRAETLALVGESGSGKTTAALTALGLLGNGLLAEGTVRCGGISMPVAGPRSPAFRRKVQIVFQDPFSSLDPRMTVGQILEEALVSLRPDLTPAERLLRMQALLKETGLAPESLERLPHEFSGGQRQRIAIARALSVGSLQRERGLAYLLITHNFAVVEHAAHRVAVMQGGRIVEEGAAAAVLTHPKAAYTKRLLASVPRL